jgi:hypothetical protein
VVGARERRVDRGAHFVVLHVAGEVVVKVLQRARSAPPVFVEGS